MRISGRTASVFFQFLHPCSAILKAGQQWSLVNIVSVVSGTPSGSRFFFMRESGKGRYDDMKEFWNLIQFIFTAVGGWLGYFLGGCDGLLIALVVFVAVDYLTGVMCAVSDKKLSSEVGFKGICRKVLIFLLVGIANILDAQVIGTGSVLRTAVIFFYLSNEGVSLLENAAHLGLPVPEKIKTVLEQLHDRAEKEEN